MTNLKNLTKIDGVVIFLSLLAISATLYYLPEPLIIATRSNGNLIAVVHKIHNAYFHLTSFGLWASTDVGVNVLLLFGLLGLTAVLSYHNILPTISLATSSTVFGIICAIFGSDFIVLGPLSILPWLYIVICNANSSLLSFSILLSTVIVSAWLLLYSMTIPVLLLAILINFIINRVPFKAPIAAVLLLGFFALLTFTAASPALPWPDYPDFSRVTTLTNGPSWLARPLIGPDLPFPTIDRPSLFHYYNYLILPAAILTIITGAIVRNLARIRAAWLCCGLGIALVFLDFRLPEEFAQIAPIQSFPRLLPELSLIPFTPLVLCLAISGLILMLILGALRSNIGAIFALIFTITVILLHQQSALSTSNINISNTWTNSPSAFVNQFFTPTVLKNASSIWHTARPKLQNITVTSSNVIAVSANDLIDKDLKTRWSAGIGKQLGTEWLMFAFALPQKIIGVELNTGEFKTDFPRAVKVLAGVNCESSSLKEVSNFPNWQGSPKFSPNGYPYFSAQSEVQIFFPDEVEVSCIRIEQTAKSDDFDWSVAEFRLIKKSSE